MNEYCTCPLSVVGSTDYAQTTVRVRLYDLQVQLYGAIQLYSHLRITDQL